MAQHGTEFHRYRERLPDRSLLQIKSFFYNQRKREERSQESREKALEAQLMGALNNILSGGDGK